MSNVKPARLAGILAIGALGIGATLDYRYSLDILPRYRRHINENILATDFSLETTGGGRVGLKEGKPNVINFWFIGCPPCEQEMPHFQKLYERAGDLGINFVSINISNTPQDIERYKKDRGFTFPVAMDERGSTPFGGKTATDYRINGYPTTCFVDRNRRMGCAVGGINYSILLRRIMSYR